MSHTTQEFFLESIIENFSSTVILIRKEAFQIVKANEKALIFLNLENSILSKTGLTDLTKLTKGKINQLLETVKKAGHASCVKFYHSDGSIRYADISLMECQDKNSDYMILILTDCTDRCVNSANIEEVEKKLKNFIRYSTGFECITDSKLKVEYFSDETKELLECEVLDAVNIEEMLLEYVHPDDREKLLLHLNEINSHASEVCGRLEFRIKTKNNNEKWLYHVCKPVFNEKGEYIGRRLSNRDVTRRKTAEFKLLKETKRFASGPVVTAVWKPEEGWPVSYISENVSEVLGYSVDEVLDKNFKYADIIHDEDLQKIAEEVDYYSSNKIDKFQQEYRIRNKNGEYVHIFDFTSVIRDNKGNIDEIIGYFYDQTDFVNIKREIEFEKAKFEYIVEASNVGSWIWNIQTGVVEFNEMWAKMLGFTLKEIEPISINTWQRLCHPEDLEKSNQLMQMYLDGKIPDYECEVRMRCKDGSYKWILDRGKTVKYSDDNTPLVLYGVHIDIDRTKQLEKRLRDYLKYLNTAQEVSKTGSWYLNVRKNSVWWSKQTYKMFGIPEKTTMDIEKFLSRVHPDDKEYVLMSWHNALLGKPYDIEHRIVSDNNIKWVNEKAEVNFDEYGTPVDAVGNVKDITEEKKLMEKIKIESKTNELLLYFLPGFLWYISKDRTILKQNKKAAEKFQSKIGGKCYMETFCGEFLPEEQKILIRDKNISLPHMKCEFCLANESLEKNTELSSDFEDKKNNRFYKVWWIPFNKDEYIHYMQDITEEKQNEQYLRDISTKDHLTGIFNRRYITERLDSELNLSKRTKRRTFSLIMFDIDHFKNVNDTYGHDVGDEVLKKITSIVTGRVRKADVPGRWGGEEFLLILPETNLLNASYLAEELRAVVEDSKIIEQQKITASFGVTQNNMEDTVDSIIKRVDDLLYESKNQGRNKVVGM